MGGGQPAKVFVSSTSEDLKSHREAARDAALAAGMLPVMMEYFAAAGDKPPLLAPKQAFPPVDNRSFRGVALGGGLARSGSVTGKASDERERDQSGIIGRI